MTTVTEKIQSTPPRNSVSRVAKYSPAGKPIDTGNGYKEHKANARYIENCYKYQMNRWPSFKKNNMPGFGPVVAATETIAATALVWCFPNQRATEINLATTLGEFVQTFIQGTDMFDSKKVTALKQEVKILKQKSKVETDLNIKEKIEADRETTENEIDALNRPVEEGVEQVLSWIQTSAGGFGIGGTLVEKFFGEKDNLNDVPLYKKITLSVASALNVFLMFFGAAEKTLMSTLNENRGLDKNLQGIRHKSMEINGRSDLRCSAEWSIMTLVPWISKIGIVKDFVDVFVGYNALKEGLGYFVDEKKIGFPKLFQKELNKDSKLYKTMDFISDPITAISKLNKNPELRNNEKEENKKDLMCFPFKFNPIKGWYLGKENDRNGPGTSGFRNRYFRPILKYFSCNPTECYLDRDGNVVSAIPDEEETLTARF